MFWVYIIAALALVAGVVTGVETYNHAISARATAEARAGIAEQRAGAERKARQDLQEIVAHEQNLVGPQKKSFEALGARLAAMEKAIAANAQRDPKVYACESTPVPADLRKLRRDTFGAAGGDVVLHPAQPTQPDPSPAAPGRDVRGPAPGGGREPDPTAGVQQRQVDRPPVAREAEPSTIRSRIEALMRRK